MGLLYLTWSWLSAAGTGAALSVEEDPGRSREGAWTRRVTVLHSWCMASPDSELVPLTCSLICSLQSSKGHAHDYPHLTDKDNEEQELN